MRLHRRSIRAKLLALLVLPLASLVGMWSFSAVSSLADAWSLMRVITTYKHFGTPVDDVAEALQDERRASVAYLADDGGHVTTVRLAAARERTGRALAVLKTRARDDDWIDDLGTRQRGRLEQLVRTLDGLDELRREVQDRALPWDQALELYSALIEPTFAVRTALAELRSGELAARAAVVGELVRARELLSREDAIITGGHTTGKLTESQYRDLVGTVDGRRLLYRLHVPELPVARRREYDAFVNSGVGWSLADMEEDVRAAGADRAASAVSGGTWRTTLDASLSGLRAIDRDSASDIGEQAHDQGTALLVRAVVTGGLGLLAVVASIAVSVRISRDLAHRLTVLRDEALTLSGVRLPAVMRRLREGDEDVDTELDAPVLRLGHDEIGQVGRAFGTVQRAAVEAALDQARLRRGISAVFTNLARRNQVLLHRQLTLLDTMERRTQDSAELEDLFRLDHMTTRMRRHAEGLLILSGNAPGRAWRRPVRIVDVVRAAVGEVEDYPRVTVRRMPRTALNGPAVADVLHLLAELIENATAFSPPDTHVTVHGERTGGGFVLKITDHGLGMGRERLEEANRQLAEERHFGLPDTDRLGLFTVSLLAARQGVRVTLGPAPTGRGTMAVVRIPQALLVAPEGGGEIEEGDTGEFRIASPIGALPSFSDSPPRRGTGTGDGAPGGPVPSTAARAFAPPPAPVAAVGGPLPRRRRQESLSPHLRGTAPDRVPPRGNGADVCGNGAGGDGAHEHAAHGHAAGGGGERSPEEARSTTTAFARGVARGLERSRETAGEAAVAGTRTGKGDGG